MITISISPQTPDHMRVVADALIKLLGLTDAPAETAAPLAVEVPKAPKQRKPAPTPPAPEAVQTEVAAPEPVAASPSEAPAAPALPLEIVRAKLATISQAGKTAEVKELISKFGATKFTDIPADKYADLLAAAEAL